MPCEAKYSRYITKPFASNSSLCNGDIKCVPDSFHGPVPPTHHILGVCTSTEGTSWATQPPTSKPSPYPEFVLRAALFRCRLGIGRRIVPDDKLINSWICLVSR
ncbi:unnamed protein product [Scytosiphon promiscuus]